MPLLPRVESPPARSVSKATGFVAAEGFVDSVSCPFGLAHPVPTTFGALRHVTPLSGSSPEPRLPSKSPASRMGAASGEAIGSLGGNQDAFLQSALSQVSAMIERQEASFMARLATLQSGLPADTSQDLAKDPTPLSSSPVSSLLCSAVPEEAGDSPQQRPLLVSRC